MTGFLEDYGLLILFLIVALQASGIPGPPGKTALVVAAILAADGRFEIWQVIAVAAVAGIVGGYTAYLVGRTGGRRLLERPFLAERFRRPFALAARFFEQHGEKAVFLARFVPGLKVVSALAAGSFGMRWWTFALWHALGATAFAVGFGLVAYWAGEGAIGLVERFGFLALAALVAAAGLGWLGYRVYRSRRRVDRLKRLRPPEAGADARGNALDAAATSGQQRRPQRREI